MAYENIILDKKGKVGWIAINRPEALNVLSMATLLEIDSALNEIERDENIWAGVLTSSGVKAFCAGADLKELGALDLVWNMNYSKTCHRVFGKIEKMGKAFVCGINGFALGGGFELTLACHLRVMSDRAYLALPELGLGAVPGAGGTQRLTRLIGKSRALYYILTGERIDANTALSMGLVHKVVAPEQVPSECEKLASLLCQKSPFAISLALQAINSGSEIDLENGLDFETALTAIATASQDAREGLQAMQSKRPPSFKGR
jgi:enoyl-CoA hydratase